MNIGEFVANPNEGGIVWIAEESIDEKGVSQAVVTDYQEDALNCIPTDLYPKTKAERKRGTETTLTGIYYDGQEVVDCRVYCETLKRGSWSQVFAFWPENKMWYSATIEIPSLRSQASTYNIR